MPISPINSHGMWVDMMKVNIVQILACFLLCAQGKDEKIKGEKIISLQEQLICFACQVNAPSGDHLTYLKAMMSLLNDMKNYTYEGSQKEIKDEQLVWMKKQLECVEYVLCLNSSRFSNFKTDFYKELVDGENTTFKEFWNQYNDDVLEFYQNSLGTSSCDIDRACNTTSADTTSADTTSADSSTETAKPSNTSGKLTSSSNTTSASTSNSTTTPQQQKATPPSSKFTAKIRNNDAGSGPWTTTPDESSQNIALYIALPVLSVLVAIAALSFRAVKQRYSDFRRRLSASSETQRKATNSNHHQTPITIQEGRGRGQKDEKEDNSEDAHHYEDVYSLAKQKEGGKDTELQYDTVTSRISGEDDDQSSQEDERGYQMLGRVKTSQRGESDQREGSENRDCEVTGEPLYEDLADIRGVGGEAMYKSTVTFETDQRALQRVKARNVLSAPCVPSLELYSGNVEIPSSILGRAPSPRHANKRYSSGLDLAWHPALRSISTSPVAAPSHRYSTNLELSPASLPNLPSPPPGREDEEGSAYETPDEMAVNSSHTPCVQTQWSRDVSPFVKSGGSPSFVPKNRYSTGLQLHSHPALIGLCPTLVSSPRQSVHSKTSLGRCSAEVLNEEDGDEDPYEIPDEVRDATVVGKDTETSGESLYENNVFHNHSSSRLVSPAAHAIQNQSHQKIGNNEEDEEDELYDQEHIYNTPD